jgi:NifU-like protein
MTFIEKEMYGSRIVEYASKPRNRGVMKKPDAVGVGGGPCGDMIEIYLKIKKKKVRGAEIEYIRDAKFETMGCAVAVAAASLVTEEIKGKTVKEAETLEVEKLKKIIGSVPLVKEHCCEMAINTLKNALIFWENKKKEKQ